MPSLNNLYFTYKVLSRVSNRNSAQQCATMHNSCFLLRIRVARNAVIFSHWFVISIAWKIYIPNINFALLHCCILALLRYCSLVLLSILLKNQCKIFNFFIPCFFLNNVKHCLKNKHYHVSKMFYLFILISKSYLNLWFTCKLFIQNWVNIKVHCQPFHVFIYYSIFILW